MVWMVWLSAYLKLVFFLCSACGWSSCEAAKPGLCIQGREVFSFRKELPSPERKRVKAGDTILQVVKLFCLATLILRELFSELACQVIWTCNRVCFYRQFWRKQGKEEFRITLSWDFVNSLYSSSYLLDLVLLFVLVLHCKTG